MNQDVYRVDITQDAERDLADIYRFVATNDSRDAANQLLDKLQDKVTSLERLPERGHVVTELAYTPIREALQLSLFSYRIIYTVDDKIVNILAIVDGRRDLEAVLSRRFGL